MAGKKRKAKASPFVPVPRLAPPMANSRCFHCDGTGQLCDICGETERFCQNDHLFAPGTCETCKGTGE